MYILPVLTLNGLSAQAWTIRNRSDHMRCSLGETQLLTWARMDQLCVFEVTQVVSEGLENSKHIPFHSFLFWLALPFLVSVSIYPTSSWESNTPFSLSTFLVASEPY